MRRHPRRGSNGCRHGLLLPTTDSQGELSPRGACRSVAGTFRHQPLQSQPRREHWGRPHTHGRTRSRRRRMLLQASTHLRIRPQLTQRRNRSRRRTTGAESPYTVAATLTSVPACDAGCWLRHSSGVSTTVHAGGRQSPVAPAYATSAMSSPQQHLRRRSNERGEPRQVRRHAVAIAGVVIGHIHHRPAAACGGLVAVHARQWSASPKGYTSYHPD